MDVGLSNVFYMHYLFRTFECFKKLLFFLLSYLSWLFIVDK